MRYSLLILIYIFIAGCGDQREFWVEKDLICKLSLKDSPVEKLEIVISKIYGKENISSNSNWIGFKITQKLASHDGNKTYSTSVDIQRNGHENIATFTLWPIADEEYETKNGQFTLLRSELFKMRDEWPGIINEINKKL